MMKDRRREVLRLRLMPSLVRKIPSQIILQKSQMIHGVVMVTFSSYRLSQFLEVMEALDHRLMHQVPMELWEVPS